MQLNVCLELNTLIRNCLLNPKGQTLLPHFEQVPSIPHDRSCSHAYCCLLCSALPHNLIWQKISSEVRQFSKVIAFPLNQFKENAKVMYITSLCCTLPLNLG